MAKLLAIAGMAIPRIQIHINCSVACFQRHLIDQTRPNEKGVSDQDAGVHGQPVDWISDHSSAAVELSLFLASPS